MLGLPADWRYLLAASYSQLGLLVASPELDEAIRKGNVLTARDRGELAKSFEMSADIIAHIPGLEPVIAIIRQFSETFRSGEFPNWNGLGDEKRGAVLLALLFESNILRMRNFSAAKIVDLLGRQLKNLPEEPLAALRAILESEETTTRTSVECEIAALKPGMVLMEDILTQDRRKLVSVGTEMTDNLILLLRHFISRGMIKSRVMIASYIPGEGARP